MSEEIFKEIFILVVGPACILGGAYWFRLTQAIRRQAVPIAAEVLESDIYPGNGGWYPFIRYRYTVNGQTFVNTQVSPPPGQKSGLRAWAKRVCRSFPAGAEVTAHYDASCPERAFLIHRVEILPLIPVALGLMLLFIYAST